MSEETSKSGRRRRRLFLLLRICAWAAFLVWFGQFAYVRVTTPTGAEAYAADEGDDAKEALVEELCELTMDFPKSPAYDGSMGTVYYPWGLYSTTAGLLGAWGPDQYNNQAAALDFVKQSATGAKLDALAELCERYEESGRQLGLLGETCGIDFDIFYDKAMSVLGALVFRARAKHADHGDIEGALSDLRAAAALETIYRQMLANHYWMFDTQIRLADFEIGRLAVEVDLPLAPAMKTARHLCGDVFGATPSDTEVRANTEAELERLLDAYYTRDADGDGWLVLSASSGVLTPYGPVNSEPRARLWNIFSPLFSSRSEVREKWLALDGLNEQTISLLRASGRALPRASALFDGPLTHYFQGVNQQQSVLNRGSVTDHQRGLAIMLALSAYKHERGGYPEELGALTPEVLSEKQLSNLVRGRFEYTKQAEGYELTGSYIQIAYNRFLAEYTYYPPSVIPSRSADDEVDAAAEPNDATPVEDPDSL